MTEASDWQPFRGPFQRWPRLADGFLALVSLFLTVAPQINFDIGEPPSFGAFLLFLIGSIALLWRRTKPVMAHGIVLSASALSMALGYTSGPIFALAFSIYSLGRYSDNNRWSIGGMVTAMALVGVNELFDLSPALTNVLPLLFVYILWYLGRRIRARGQYLALLQERTTLLAQEKHIEAERAVEEERTRISRELHDIVAHRVSLMTVQAGAAKTVIGSNPEAAATAISAVESEGRRALEELRHLMGVLRPHAGQIEMAPQPGLDDVRRLVQAVRKSGQDVSISIEGIEGNLPALVDLAIFRIVQESLTNVIKHAGTAAQTEVKIHADHQAVSVEVRDNGMQSTRLPGSGHGINGMKERASQLGGKLVAGPLPGGGFSVNAILPLPRATA